MASQAGTNINNCLESQVEEIEVLLSIYGNEWKTENEADRSYSIEIKENDVTATLHVRLPETYPHESPPTFLLVAPGLSREQKTQLTCLLEEVYLQNIGQAVLFQWIDKIKEYLSSLASDENVSQGDIFHAEEKESKAFADHETTSNSCKIIHGEPIIDRKNIFQGHASVVLSVDEVRQVLNELKKKKKIAKATHNMYAYRISCGNCCKEDCNDDGENSAGSRLLHLLQILNANNVLVVVSRWFSGIHLGPTRFQHINNAAQQVLQQAGLINSSKKNIKL